MAVPGTLGPPAVRTDLHHHPPAAFGTEPRRLEAQLGGGQVNTATGDFVFGMLEAYLIENGRILHENLNKTQFNLDDLRQELHKKGLDFSSLKDIKLARLESCGTFSVIKAPDMEPLTRRDLDNFIRSLSDNPLSPAGAGWAELRQLVADLRAAAEHFGGQRAAAPPEKPAPPPAELH